jgi:hypothetical protein
MLFKKNDEVNFRNRVQHAYYFKVLKAEVRDGKNWYLINSGYRLDPANPNSDRALDGQWFPEESLIPHKDWKKRNQQVC